MCFMCCLCAIVKHQRLDPVVMCVGGSWYFSGPVSLKEGRGLAALGGAQPPELPAPLRSSLRRAFQLR